MKPFVLNQPTDQDPGLLHSPDDDEETNHLLRRRRSSPFVSHHRRALDRIATDSGETRRHRVPHYLKQSSFWESIIGYCQRGYSQERVTVLETLCPASRWLKTYSIKDTLLSDFIAGMTVGVMIVPQSMSYAKLAGLPVQYGLYSSLMPVFAYSIFGSSRQLAVGPVALISLLLGTGLSTIMKNKGFANKDDPEYQQVYAALAIQCSFLVGITYILMGIVRLGFVTIFLSHAVISGFTTGAAVIIGMSQIKYIFGYSIDGKQLHVLIKNLIAGLDQFNYKTFLTGTLSLLMLVLLKHVGKTYKRFSWVRAMGPLTVTVITIILTAIFSLDTKGIPIVGFIPSGLPTFTADLWLPISDFEKLSAVVISITVVGFMESIAIAKQLAAKHKYEIDSSQELIGLGMANFVGGMFQSYPVTGSFSRSAVNHESGAESGISGMVTAILVGVVLLLLTPVFEKIPLAVLSAIVISGVLGLLDYPEAIYLWKVHRFDFCVWLTACLGTMFLGVEIGLGIAVGVSLLVVIYESAYPHTSVMGRLPGTNHYRNVKQYPEAERYDGIVIIRIDAPLYFANAQNTRDTVRKYRLAAQSELDARSPGMVVKYLVFDMSPVSHVDTSALHILDDMVETYRSRGQEICFANPSLLVMERFVQSGLADKVGRDLFFVSLQDAVHWCLNELDADAVSHHNSAFHVDGCAEEVAVDLAETATTRDSDVDIPTISMY